MKVKKNKKKTQKVGNKKHIPGKSWKDDRSKGKDRNNEIEDNNAKFLLNTCSENEPSCAKPSADIE